LNIDQQGKKRGEQIFGRNNRDGKTSGKGVPSFESPKKTTRSPKKKNPGGK